MSAELNAEIKRLSRLKQYQDAPLEDLEPIARLNNIIRDFKSQPMFDIETDKGKKEQELAEIRFKNYLENSELESASDIDTLKSLIFNEIFEVRIQKRLNDLAKEDKYPSDKNIKSLVDVQDQKNALKIKLGIDKKEEEKDELSALQLYQKRVHKHIQDHKNEFTLYIPWTCKCGHKDIEPYLIYKRIKDFKALKHPWFVGRFLFNYEIIKDVKDKKLSPEDATRYLMCAGRQVGDYDPQEDKKYCIDYVKFCIENWTEITELINKK